MSYSLGIAIESLVAILLMLTIGYCMLLNKRLQRLKADEHSLKATIGELITATEIAERAIGGLKHTVRDVNENLGSQLTAATQMSAHLKNQLAEGDTLIRRVSKIVHGRAPRPPSSPPRPRRRSRPPRRLSPPPRRSPTQKGQWPRRMKSFRDIRVLPVVLVAIFGLVVLKVAGLVLDGGYVFDYRPAFEQGLLGAGDDSIFLAAATSSRAIRPISPARCRARKRRSKSRRSRRRPRRLSPPSPPASWSFPSRRRRYHPPSARSWNGCRRAGRSWSSARERSRSARAC